SAARPEHGRRLDERLRRLRRRPSPGIAWMSPLPACADAELRCSACVPGARALIRDLAVNHRDVGLNLTQAIERHRQLIVGDDHEIREFADLDAALVFLLE